MQNEALKVRHTFHLQGPVLEKLRDVVRYIQKHRNEFSDEDITLFDNLSRFTETAVVEKIIALEEKRGSEFPKRRRDKETGKIQGVHFGRPPVVGTKTEAA